MSYLNEEETYLGQTYIRRRWLFSIIHQLWSWSYFRNGKTDDNNYDHYHCDEENECNHVPVCE